MPGLKKLYQTITGFWLEKPPKGRRAAPLEMQLTIEKGRGVVRNPSQPGDYTSLNGVLKDQPAVPIKTPDGGEDIALVGVRDNGRVVLVPNSGRTDPIDTDIRIVPADAPDTRGLDGLERGHRDKMTENKQYFAVCGPANKQVVTLGQGRDCDPDDYDSLALGAVEKALYKTGGNKVWGIGNVVKLQRLQLPD